MDSYNIGCVHTHPSVKQLCEQVRKGKARRMYVERQYNQLSLSEQHFMVSSIENI